VLMMSRREGEIILIGDEIEIVIAHIGRSRVKVGIRAPRETQVIAREVKLVRDENLAAVRVAAEMNLPALLKKFQPGSSSFSKPVRKGD
jgi:carbon storage regulator